MKDLKHLLYFENLLQEAHNDLVAQAQNEGKICVAYACENTPEPLLNLPGAFSTRLRAPRTGSMEMATYYMTSFLCEYSRALLERAIEGGYNFADCMITPDGCTMMNRAVENMELLKTMGKSKPKFFYEYMEIPMKADDNGLNLYVLQCRNHILTPLHEHYGIDVSDAAIRSAVAEHNHVCELIRAIGEDPDREGLIGTPDRIMRMWKEIFRGYDPAQKPKITTFANEEGLSDIVFDCGDYYSMCEHHILPFFGRYYFAYIPSPKGRILGISKVARVVGYCAARLQLQERLARDIVQMLSEALNNEALGFAIVMKGQHLCKTMRGVRNDGKMSVAHFTGVFNLNSDLRKEFYKLIDLNSNG